MYKKPFENSLKMFYGILLVFFACIGKAILCEYSQTTNKKNIFEMFFNIFFYEKNFFQNMEIIVIFH